MSLLTAMNQTATTENGDLAHHSTLSNALDLFYKVGASRNSRSALLPVLHAALADDEEIAIRIMLWARDVRGGAGERETFRFIITHLVNAVSTETANAIIKMIPEVGRFDDLLIFADTQFESLAFDIIGAALKAGNSLAAKWVPRQGRGPQNGAVAKKLRKYLDYNDPKSWRKMLAELSKSAPTVEQQMSAGQWDNINFEHVPSLAHSRYRTAFYTRQPERFTQFLADVKSGEKKINASAIFPHDVIRGINIYNYKSVQNDAIIAQWNALPDYLNGTTERILPLVDVSGSMDCTVGGNTTAMDVAVALGLYLSERLDGAFKDHFMTFSANPKLELLTGNVVQRTLQLRRAEWGMNTNFRKVFRVLLNQAMKFNLPESEMPTKIMVFSDMQFDQADHSDTTSFDDIKEIYEQHGYTMPTIIFWNLRDGGTMPVTKHESGTALVSGFSPAIMKDLLGGSLTPESVMLAAVGKDRYDYRKYM